TITQRTYNVVKDQALTGTVIESMEVKKPMDCAKTCSKYSAAGFNMGTNTDGSLECEIFSAIITTEPKPGVNSWLHNEYRHDFSGNCSPLHRVNGQPAQCNINNPDKKCCDNTGSCGSSCSCSGCIDYSLSDGFQIINSTVLWLPSPNIGANNYEKAYNNCVDIWPAFPYIPETTEDSVSLGLVEGPLKGAKISLRG
ncbi:unnamed protein product, partial [Meganyctiphanes norvegica]